MKIADVRTIALRGATHDTGWPGGTDPNEQMNTLVEIRAGDGLSGIGSCSSRCCSARPCTRRSA
jgi:D-galactarolactone cycloisomerase